MNANLKAFVVVWVLFRVLLMKMMDLNQFKFIRIIMHLTIASWSNQYQIPIHDNQLSLVKITGIRNIMIQF